MKFLKINNGKLMGGNENCEPTQEVFRMPRDRSAQKQRQRANRRLGRPVGIPTRSSFPTFWELAYWLRPSDTEGLSNEEAIKIARRRVEVGQE